VLGLLIGCPCWRRCFRHARHLRIPTLRGFNFAGGSRIIPIRGANAALSTYTAAFSAEIVRAGILSSQGANGSGSSLGLQRGSTLRLIVVPEGVARMPPITNQYLKSHKNSSLAVAIVIPIWVSVFAGTTLSQTAGDRDHLDHHGVYSPDSLITARS